MAATQARTDLDPYGPKPPKRIRPHVSGTIAADVAERLHAEHEARGGPFGHVLEDVIRRGLERPGP